MKIVEVATQVFGYRSQIVRDSEGHSHPGPEHDASQCLLHPFLDYDRPPPWLRELVDPLDAEGYVHVSQRPGLGLDIDFDYIQEHLR